VIAFYTFIKFLNTMVRIKITIIITIVSTVTSSSAYLIQISKSLI